MRVETMLAVQDSGNAELQPKLDSSGLGRAGVMPWNGAGQSSPTNIMETEEEGYLKNLDTERGRGRVSASGGNYTGNLEQCSRIVRDEGYDNFVSITS